MYRIVKKEPLNDTVTRMVIEAPRVAQKAHAGQFIILRSHDDAERIPLTVAGYDRENGTVTVIFQVVGAATMRLNCLNEGEYIHDFAGPLGRPTETEGVKKALVVGGGVGCAIALPVAQALREQGCSVTGVIGFRSKELVILRDEFSDCCDRLITVTDDGSAGEKGNVTAPVSRLLAEGEQFDRVFVIGPLIMMKFVAQAVQPYGIPCTVSMNPIMIDGTGMCGGCRLTLIQDGKRVTRFACVDGPEFDGYQVDFDEAIARSHMYRTFESAAREAQCNLFREVQTNGSAD